MKLAVNTLLFCVAALLVLGMVMLYSASMTQSGARLLKMQLFWCALSGGLGLGIFIARTLLERSGAKVSFRNRIFPAHGAIVHIMWPRETFEIEETRLEPAN